VKLLYIRGQSDRHQVLAVDIRRIPQVFKRKSGRIDNGIIADHLCRHLDDHGIGEVCLAQRENVVDDFVHRAHSLSSGFFDDFLNDKSLPLRTLHVVSGCIADPGIRDCLHAVQRIRSVCLRQFLIRHAGDLRSLDAVVVQVDRFILGHRDGNAADIVNKNGNRLEIDGQVIRNGKVQVRIQHGKELLDGSVAVGGIGFLEIVVVAVDVQVGIPVDGHQLDFPVVVVDAGNDHRVGIAEIKIIRIPCVDAQKRNVRIALHDFVDSRRGVDRDIVRIQVFIGNGRSGRAVR